MECDKAGPLPADAVSLVMDIDESWSAIVRPTGCTHAETEHTSVMGSST